jgi:hypothetical protein
LDDHPFLADLGDGGLVNDTLLVVGQLRVGVKFGGCVAKSITLPY